MSRYLLMRIYAFCLYYSNLKPKQGALLIFLSYPCPFKYKGFVIIVVHNQKIAPAQLCSVSVILAIKIHKCSSSTPELEHTSSNFNLDRQDLRIIAHLSVKISVKRRKEDHWVPILRPCFVLSTRHTQTACV